MSAQQKQKTPEEKQAQIDDIVEHCHDLAERNKNGDLTGAWRYLADRRIDPSTLPSDVKMHRQKGKGAVSVHVRDANGNVVGAQQIFVNQDGTPRTIKYRGEDLKKLSFGAIKGTGFRFPSEYKVDKGPGMFGREYPPQYPIIAEGFETAASIWQAFDRKVEVYCAFGAPFMGDVLLPKPNGGKSKPGVIVFGDADDPDTEGVEHTARSIQRLMQRGYDVQFARPNGEGGRDANDVLKDEGAEAVRALVRDHGRRMPEDIAKLVNKFSARKTPKGSEQSAPPPADDGRMDIEFDDSNLPVLLNATQDAMLAKGLPIYQRYGTLVQTVRLEQAIDADQERRAAGALTILPCDGHALRILMSGAIRFHRWDHRAKEEKNIAPPLGFAMAMGAYASGWKYRVLGGISDIPIMRRDGTICATEGYDPLSTMLLNFNGVEFPPIPENPTRDDALAAVRVLDEVLKGFPFDGDSDGTKKGPSRSVALSEFCSTAVSQTIDAVPAHVNRAPDARTGKTLIFECASLMATGRMPSAMSYTGREEEDEKRLVGAYQRGGPQILIDNAKKGAAVGGDFLCASITGSVTSCRNLGATGQVDVPTNSMICISGNNITVAGDMAVRAVVCTLDARMESPGERTFTVDLQQYVLDNRPKLIAAVLTVLRAFIVAPDRQEVLDKLKPFGGFRRWTELVRGTLVWLGEDDPVVTNAVLHEEDPERANLSLLMHAWASDYDLGVFGDPDLEGRKRARWYDLRRVLDVRATSDAIRSAITAIFPPPKEVKDATLGIYLKTHLGKVVTIGDRKLKFATRNHPTTRRKEYALVEVDWEPDAEAAIDAGPEQQSMFYGRAAE